MIISVIYMKHFYDHKEEITSNSKESGFNEIELIILLKKLLKNDLEVGLRERS